MKISLDLASGKTVNLGELQTGQRGVPEPIGLYKSIRRYTWRRGSRSKQRGG